jgi:HMG-box domain
MSGESALWMQRMCGHHLPQLYQPQQPPPPVSRNHLPPKPPPYTSLAHHYYYYYPSPLPCPALLFHHRATAEANHGATTVMEPPGATTTSHAYHAAELASMVWPQPPTLDAAAPDAAATMRVPCDSRSNGPEHVPYEARKETSSTTFSAKKPKRALSAYNLFFQAERQRLLEEHEAATETGHCRQRHRQRGRPKHSPPPPLTEGRKKLGFEDLAKVIAQRWKDLDQDSSEMKTYVHLAAVEKKRYQAEKQVWDKHKEVALTKQWQELEKSVGEQTRKEYLDQVSGGSKKRKTSS